VASVPKGQQDFVKRRRPCENHQIRTRRPLNPPKLTKIEKQRSTAIQRSRDTARRRKKMKKKSRITNPPPTIDRRGRGGGARGAGITGARRSTTRAQGMEWRQSAAAVAVPGTRNCGMVGVEHSSDR